MEVLFLKDKNKKKKEEITVATVKTKRFRAIPIKNTENKDPKVSTARKSKVGVMLECPSCEQKVSKKTMRQCSECGKEFCKDCLVRGERNEILCMDCIEE